MSSRSKSPPDAGTQEAFAARLREIIGRESVRSFARRAGVGDRTLRQYLGGETEPTRPILVAIANAAGVSVEWLATGRGPPSSAAPKEPEVERVPRYEVRVGAGAGIVGPAVEDQTGSVPFPSEVLRALGLRPTSMAAVTVRGDSMEPTLHDGDLVLLDVTPGAVAREGVYVVRFGDELLVKRLQRLADGRFLVSSDNPAYKPLSFDSSEGTDAGVVGRVVWAGKRLG